MRKVVLFCILSPLLSSHAVGQVIETPRPQDDRELRKGSLLFDLQTLDLRAAKLDKPLARALTKAEIADAAWALEQDWAQKLLREAYDLTFPDEEERLRLRKRAVGAAPLPPTPNDRASSFIRNRVLAIAHRNRECAAELIRLGAEQLGTYEEHIRSASLGHHAIEQGDVASARRYILQGIEADPTQITAPSEILELAGRDRAAADDLIIQYISRLREFPLPADRTLGRVDIILNRLVFPPQSLEINGRTVQPPSAAVRRAYVTFVVEYLTRIEQSNPGSLKRVRPFLLAAWLPLQEFAPELIETYKVLEALSRSGDRGWSLPTVTRERADELDDERRIKHASTSEAPHDRAITGAIRRGDFADARKLIDKLSNGPQKTALIETVNLNESISLAKKSDMIGALRSAELLKKATSVLQAFPLIIDRCVIAKDRQCVISAGYKAMELLRQADNALPLQPKEIPPAAMLTAREFDPVVLSFGRLARAVAKSERILAMDILDETVRLANQSKLDTSTGAVGFDLDLFRELAPKDEVRVEQAARNFDDPLRQIVALAAVYQWKARELSKLKK